MRKIYCFTLVLFFLWACGNDPVSKAEESVSENKVCIEGAHTTIGGIKYVCEKDEFVPEEESIKDASSSSTKSSSSLIQTAYSSKGEPVVGEDCTPGDWRQWGEDDKIVCMSGTWELQSEIIASFGKSSSSISSSSSSSISRNLSISTGLMTDDRDGKVYKTVTIGSQTWMAENLNYSDSIASPNLKLVSGCIHDSIEYCEKYGRLYAWTSAMDLDYFTYTGKNATDAGVIKNPHQGICPNGWHIPNDDEWNILGSYLGEKNERNTEYPHIGKGLKYTGVWYSIDLYGDTTYADPGTNEYGFNALPAGSASASTYGNIGERTTFWSATELYKEPNSKILSYSYATSWKLGSDDNLDYYDHDMKLYWYSVRCVKD